MKKQHRFAVSIFPLSLLAIPLTTFARVTIENVGSTMGVDGEKLAKTLTYMQFYAFFFFTAVALVLFGGILWATAAFNKDKVASAKKIHAAKRIVLWTFVGFAVVFLVFVILDKNK